MHCEFERTGYDGEKVRGKLTGPDGKRLIRVYGPFSSPTQHISEYNEVMVVASGDGKEQMREARAAHRARWRRERDERGKRRMTRVGGAAAAVAALALLALGTRRRTKRRDDDE